ncbi:hypothetical protein N2152v2_010083 [Parachlorella kessleri]
MAELRGGKHLNTQGPRHHYGDQGDSPVMARLENGNSLFDKVVELQATTASKSPNSTGGNGVLIKQRPRLQERGANGWRALQNVFRRLFTPRLRGLVLLNLVMLACASSFVVLKEGQNNLDPFVFSSLRFVIAALAFTPILRGGVLKDPNIVRGGIEIGIWAAGGYLTQSVGMVTAEASRGAFLNGLTVVVVPVCAGLAGSGVKRTTWAAVAVALAGIYLLEGSGSPPTWGDFWNFASAVLFSLQIFRTEHYTKTYSARAGLSMMAVALLVIAALSLLSMIVAFPVKALYFVRRPSVLARLLLETRLPWLEILYLGIGVTDGGLWAEVYALQDVSSIEAAFVYTLEPVAGAALAYVALGERWGPSGWVGAALIIASNVVTQLYGVTDDGHHHHQQPIAEPPPGLGKGSLDKE